MPDTPKKRFPHWMRKRIPATGRGSHVREILDRLELETVCSQAHCPNQCECFADGTATFMILGRVCTRHCRFCAVADGSPQPVRDDEPERLAQAAAEMALQHVVITSVTRDDLPDGGARHFARCIEAVRAKVPGCTIEVLVPDFQGDDACVDTVADARPDVFNHNVETVRRLYDTLRPEADLDRSLRVLLRAKANAPVTKSGLMVGAGETHDEVFELMNELRGVDCDILTIGQYLAPSKAHHEVAAFVEPAEFERYEREARTLGFKAVAAGPFVRSSYRAGEELKKLGGGGG